MLLIATEDGGEMASERKREREKQSRPGTKSAPKSGKECSLAVESVEVAPENVALCWPPSRLLLFFVPSSLGLQSAKCSLSPQAHPTRQSSHSRLEHIQSSSHPPSQGQDCTF